MERHNSGCTLWVYGRGEEETTAVAAKALAQALSARNLPVEEIDAVSRARQAYRQSGGAAGLQLALGFTAAALNRHGVHVVIRSGRGASSGFGWGKDRPDHLLDVVVDGDPPPAPKPTPAVRLDSIHDTDESGESEIRFDVSRVLTLLAGTGWIPESEPVGTPVEDEEIRRRLEKLGYL